MAENYNTPGESIQLVLSVLADQEDHHAVELQNLLDFLVQQSNIQTTKQSHNLPDILAQILKQLSSQQDSNDLKQMIQSQLPVANNDKSFYTIWFTGLLLVSLLLQHPEMTPFEIHSVAVQALVFHLPRDNNDNPNSIGGVWTLCMVLCTLSLEQCCLEIQQQQQEQGQKRIRWKRIKSLVLETLQLYQRHALLDAGYAHAHEENNNDDDEIMKGNCQDYYVATLCKIRIPLWTNYILPQCHTLWSLFPDTVVPSSSVFWEAVVVSISSHLAVQVSMSQDNNDNSEEQWLLEDLFNNLLKYVGDMPLDQIWCHPWRVANFQRGKQQQLHNIQTSMTKKFDSLDWWTLERGHERGRIVEDEEDEGSGDDDHSTPPLDDDYENIDTTWEDLGVTLLAWKGWSDPQRPNVYSFQYEAQLWFPHINTLLNPDQHSSSSQITTLRLMRTGFHWLQNLLPMIPQHSLILPTSFTLGSTFARPCFVHTKYSSPEASPPNHPLRTFQLLFNAIVSTASSPTRSAAALPSATELFVLCKALLSKYKASCQLDLVFQDLLPTCPHTGLKPKIMDLLRPLLVLFAEEGNSVGKRLWQCLVDIIRELGNYCDYNEKGDTGKIRGLKHTEELIDQAEFFTSACTMIQLGWNIRMVNSSGACKENEHPSSISLEVSQSTPGIIDTTVVSLKNFHDALKRQLEQWDRESASGLDSSPPQYFRLCLLENLLQQLVDL